MIKPHFVRKGCAGRVQIAILPQFLAIEPHFYQNAFEMQRFSKLQLSDCQRERPTGQRDNGTGTTGQRERDNGTTGTGQRDGQYRTHPRILVDLLDPNRLNLSTYTAKTPRHDCTRSFQAFLEVGNGGRDANREHEKSQPPAPSQERQYMPVFWR